MAKPARPKSSAILPPPGSIVFPENFIADQWSSHNAGPGIPNTMSTPASETRPAPLVSICIITYRHARFIRQCVEGMLAQETDFPYEILIGEDESDDGTREICLELATAHPDRVRVLLHRRQDVVIVDGQPRGTHNLMATLAQARGEFVALCEGDDYWTDPKKLQIQVAYLHANADCVGCFHEASLVDADSRELQAEFFKRSRPNPKPKYDRRDCLSLMSVYPTCSLFYRRAAFDAPEWYMKRSCDFFFDLVITAYGKLGYIDRRMAAYRRHEGGIWSCKAVTLHLVEQIVRLKHLLNVPYFLANHRDELLALIERFQGMLASAGELQAAKKQIEQQAETLRKLAADREKLITFVNKQHAIIQEFGQQRSAAALAPTA